MKILRIVCFSLLFFSAELMAQPFNAGSDSVEIPQGVIYVRKPHIRPFVKVDYKLYLCRVDPNGLRREIPVTDRNTGFTDIQIETVPLFDSAFYSKKLERTYPQKSYLFSKYFVENLKYQYQASDTPRVDTMVIGMWIDKSGKIKRAMPDTEYTGNMPRKLVTELAGVSMRMTDWGEKGGYKTKKKFLRPSQLVIENYYCEFFVIVSSYPVTNEQKKSGTAYALFDYPLNSPPTDEQQRQSMEKNGGLPPLK